MLMEGENPQLSAAFHAVMVVCGGVGSCVSVAMFFSASVLD